MATLSFEDGVARNRAGTGFAKSLIHAKIESALAPYLEVIR